MNQCITELAQEATTEISGVPVLDQKKFAELIVRECISIAEAGLAPAAAGVMRDRFGIDHE
jgi:hypothetical protein